VPSLYTELVLEGSHDVAGFNLDLGLPRRFSICPPTSRLPYLCLSPSSLRLPSPERACVPMRATRGKVLAARTVALSAHKVSPSSERDHAHDGNLRHAVSGVRHRLPRLLFPNDCRSCFIHFVSSFCSEMILLFLNTSLLCQILLKFHSTNFSITPFVPF
jgi:hypothetical protein